MGRTRWVVLAALLLLQVASSGCLGACGVRLESTSIGTAFATPTVAQEPSNVTRATDVLVTLGFTIVSPQDVPGVTLVRGNVTATVTVPDRNLEVWLKVEHRAPERATYRAVARDEAHAAAWVRPQMAAIEEAILAATDWLIQRSTAPASELGEC